MSFDLHHAHLFASDIDATVEWWCQHMCATVVFDMNWLAREMSFSP